MKNKVTVMAVLILMISSVSADSFRRQHDKNRSPSKTYAPKKLAEFTYRKMKHAVYLIPAVDEDEENIEFIKIAQRLHDAEPNTALILVDDDSGLKRYLAFMKAVERSGGGAPDQIKFPRAWAEEHILGNVGAVDENNRRRWYLLRGYRYEKIAELQ